MNEPETILLGLYDARLAARESKKLRSVQAAEIGQCDGIGDGTENAGPCYFRFANRKDQWCDICNAKQPAWEDYQKKSAASAAALRAAVRFGKSIRSKLQEAK